MMLLILIPWFCNFAEGQYLSVIPVLEEVVALREGQTVTLSATLDHSSTVTISKFDVSWTKTSGSLPSDAQFIVTGTSSQLIINRVKIEDEGEYSVTVRGRRNDGGYIDKSAQIILTLLGQIKIEPEFPVKSVICCGDSVTLSVTINGDVEPGDIKWTREDSNWRSDRYLPSSQNLELIISDIRESDSGTYLVEVTRDNFSGSAAILLLVQSKPRITGEVLVERSVGQSVYLQLTFTPVVDRDAITWFKDNKKIVDNLSSDGTQLQINNVKVEDSGVYSCIASNSVGTGQHTTQITITGIPLLEITPLSQHVTPGDKMQIYCSVAQSAALRWYLNDMELPNKVLLPRVTVYGSNPSYVLILNFLPKHQGEYKCRTQSKLSNIQGSATVYMRDVPQLKNTTSRAVLAQQGGEARFSVDITQLSPRKSPEFSISWSRDGDEIQEYDTRYQFLDNSRTLKILSTDLSDEGVYSVEAMNNNGSSTLHFYLSFSGRSSAPVVYNVAAPDTLLQGETVTLYCSVGGNPVPEISWYFGNTLLTTSSMVVLFNVTSRDTGNYECRGSNSLGSDSATRYVRIRGTPRVKAKVSPLVKNVGGTATLQVYVDVETYMNPLDTKITWSRSDGNLIDSRVSYQDNMRKLVIYNTEESDAGIYIIRASNPEFNIRETSILLKITKNPVLSSPTMKQTSLVGSTARLLVVADALPRPDPSQIRWTHNNSMVVMTTVSSDGLSLTLSDVQPTHAGVYRFRYLNSFIDMTLIVQQPPHIFRTSEVQQTVAAYGEASFVCSFTGYPFPTVRWYQGYNELLNSNTRYEISPDFTVLKIRNVQRSDSTAHYRCEITNDAGSDSATFQLTVATLPVITALQSVIEIESEGESVVLQVAISGGNPNLDITWTTPWGLDIFVSSGRYSLSNMNRRLTISDTRYQDAGIYTCKVYSGSDTVSRTVTLRKPDTLPTVTVLNSVTVIAGSTATFRAYYTGSATSVQWFKDSIILNSNYKYQSSSYTETHELTVNNVQSSDSGQYTLTLSTFVASVSASASLEVVERPVFDEQPQTQIVELGDNAIFSCSLQLANVQMMKLVWMSSRAGYSEPVSDLHNNRYLIQLDVDNLRSTLVVYQFSDQDSDQEVWCEATNLAGTTSSNKVRLLSKETGVYQPTITLISYPEGIVVGNEGDEVTIQIACSGKPDSVQWTRQPNTGTRLQLTTENTVLTLPSLSSLDTGSYTVSATNSYGTGSLTFNVAMSSGNPSGPISIVPVHADITAEVGSTVELRALVLYPTFLNRNNLIWSRDGVSLPPGRRYSFSESNTNLVVGQSGRAVASLTVSSVTLADSGLYKVYFSGSYYQSAAGEMRLTVLESTDTVLTDSIATLSRLSPQKITVYAGAAITLQISTGPDTRSDSRTTWTKVPGTISPSRSSYRDNGRTLVITSTIVSDTGTYRVSAERSNSLDFQVSVIDSERGQNRAQTNSDITVTPVNSNVYVNLGETATLSVLVSGPESISSLDVRWEKCNEMGLFCSRITHNKDTYFNYNTQLRVHNVAGGDDGVYRCLVAGLDQITRQGDVTLSITGSSIIVRPEQSKFSVEVGQKATLLATITGLTSLSSRDITWTHNGRLVDRQRFISSFYTSPYRTSIVCQSVFLNDAGSYIVTVKTTDGSGFSEVVLEVLDANSIELTTSDLSLREGETAIFQVRITVYPSPSLAEIEWQKDTFPLNTDSSSNKYQLSADRRTLSVNFISTRDSGYYRCTIRNSVYISNSNILTVIDKLLVRPVKPTVYSGYQDDVSLSVVVQPDRGYTDGTVDWYKGGNRVVVGGRISRSRWGRTIFISNVTEGDIDTYTVTVSYDSYTRSAEIQLRYYNGEGVRVEAVEGDVQARYGTFVTISVTIQSDPHPTLEEITWYKGDLDTKASGDRLTVGGKGTELNIALTRASDYTSYICRVSGGESLCVDCTDCAGKCAICCATVTLSATEQSGANIEVAAVKALYTVGESVQVTFTDRGSAFSVNQITWYKGVYPISTGGRYLAEKLSITQYQLTIQNSDADDNGVYAVVYKTDNNGSPSSGIKELTVKVLGDPMVTVTPVTALVTEGSDVTFTCSAAASSTALTYKWEKNRAVIAGETDHRLTITDAKHENAAEYKCTVSFTEGREYTSTAIAYLVINDDVTLEVLTPFVLADVTNAQASLSFRVTIRSQGQVTSGIVTWYKDNNVLLEGDGISFASARSNLLISNPTSANEGNYRVMVELTTVTLEGSMQLAVTSALPTVVFSETTYVGRSGEQLIVNIEVGGNPVPEVSQIEWYLNNVRLYQGDSNVRFSDNYLTLYRSQMTSAEGGLVKVAVETSAGRTEETAEVVVITQNDIQEQRSSENQLLGKSVVLSVEFHMMPLPVEQNVQWTRASEILTDTDPRIEFYKSGKELLIKDAQLADAGQYRITVNTPGGGAVSKGLLVNIRTLTERLEFSTKPTEEVTVDEGSKAVISCDVTGTPSPTIHFEYKNGTQIRNKGRFYVTSTSLEIWAAQVSDTSEYKCLGQNGDETVTANFKVTVNQRIVILAESDQVQATIGSTAAFTVYVTPTNAKITWTRQGVLFPESDGGHYDVETDAAHNKDGVVYKKEVLTISRVQSSDLGEYEATASYNDDRYINRVDLRLTNVGSTVVSITASTSNIEVYEGRDAKFTCSVSIDQSTITWTKNGVDVTLLDDSIKARYVLSNSKQDLTVQQTAALDEGLYMCLVTSPSSGSDQASATLTVLPPIKITEYPTHKRLLVGTGSQFQLSVKVNTGSEAKAITWQKDGDQINGDTEMITLSVPSSPRVNSFTVTASLSSWLNTGEKSDTANIYVTTYGASEVQEAVVIQAPEDQTAILGSTVTFECVAFGIPDPTVRWTNGSADMDTSFFSNKYTERGVESKLIISNIRSYYQGEYRCKADNLKGSIQTKPVYMELINPPSIRLVDSVYYGVPGKELVIPMEVVYQNQILKSMTKWFRNGEQLVEEVGKISFSGDGTSLVIVNVESSSAGTYSFTIETEAGSASTSTTLEIIPKYIEPTATIPKFFNDVVAYKGSVYYLKCNVAGKPVPKVVWKRTDNKDNPDPYTVHDESREYSVQPDSSLKIKSVKETDAGTWTCVAESYPEGVLRQDEASLTLQVVEWLYRPFVYPYQGHETITVVSGDTLEANIEVMYRHQIRAHNIIWKRLDFGLTDWSKATELNLVDPGYDNVVSFARDRRQLMVRGISKMYEGQYRAYVRTVAGEADTTILVYVISRVSPNVRWLDTIGGIYYTVNGEEDFVFNVNVTGEPFPKEITWYKKTGQAYEGLYNGTIGNYVYTIGYYGDMYVQNPDKSSSGFYKIQVLPERGGLDQMEEASVELVVKDYYLGFQTAPYVGGIQKIGVPVTMECLARGVPDPDTIMWYRGITKLSTATSQLTISSVKKEDKGDYYCVASNTYGTIYSPRVSLQVQYLDDEFEPITCYRKQTVDGLLSIAPCSPTNLIEGDVFTLFCNGPDGWPYPKTTWYFNDDVIVNNANGLSPAPNQYGDLVFPWAQPSNSGKYTCGLTNDQGSKSNYNPLYDVKVASSDDTSIDNAKGSEWLIQPDDITVAQHTPVTIACMVSSYPEPSYEWTFNNQAMQNIPGVTKELSFGKRLLVFDLINEKADGKYSCKTWVEKDGKRTETKNADFTLTVATRPSFVDAPIFQVGRIGDETEIDLLTPTGNPVPTVVWTFNGEGVQLEGRIKLVDGRKLRIDPTQAGDAGIWQATATNKAGSAQHAIYLKIEEKLEFTESPSSVSGPDSYVPQFETVKFPCKVRGNPAPQIYQWYRQKHLDEPFNGLPARAYMDEEKSLIIPFAQTWDNGTYFCNVTNEYFEGISGAVVLKVIQPPSIFTPPQDFKIENFGDKSSLLCLCEPQAVAIQNCMVQWRRNGVKVDDRDTSVKVIDYTSVLTILSTQERHLGEYECYGHNSIGSASAFAFITKSYKPYMTTKPPDTVTAGSKSSVNLECHAIGFPPINYMWTLNEIPIQDSRLEITSTGTLLIDGVESKDTGTFTCYASNPYGQVSVSTTLTVVGPPTKPSAPWISQISRDSGNNLYSAIVNINTDGYSSISKRILTLKQTESGVTTTIPTTSNTYTLRNLEAKPYTISVVVQNKFEASESSEPSGRINLADYNDIPHSAVENVRVKDNNAYLAWGGEEAQDTADTPDSYKVYISEVGTSDGRSYLGLSTEKEYAIDVDNTASLKHFTEYYFQVVPVKNGKEGLYSKPLLVRTQPAAPATPLITAFNYTTIPGEIIVSFDRKWSISGGIIKEFEIFYARNTSDYNIGTKKGVLSRDKRQSQGSVKADSAAVNIRISDLNPGEPYIFSMLTVNELGLQSEKSEATAAKTQTGLPGVPTITNRDGSGRDAILVKWSAPTITNGQILGYYVYYRLDNSFNDVAARVSAPFNKLYHNVTGLEEGFTYELAVSAFTEEGEGEKSSWEEARTRPKSVPNIMETPVVKVVDWHTIEVTWKLLDDGLTGIDTFTIYLNSQIDGGEGSSYKIPNRNDRYARITSLDENTSFTLSIVAENWIGSSKKSAQASFRTPKKPVYLRVWVAGTITGGVIFILMCFFFLMFYYFIWKKQVPKPLKEEKTSPMPYIARDVGRRPGDNGSLVLNNPVAAPPQGSERYSSRNSRQDNYRPEDVRMSELRAKQPSDNSQFANTKPRQKYDDEYDPTYADSYSKEQYNEKNSPYDDQLPDDRYYGNEDRYYGNDRYDDRDRYNSQYDDDRFSGDTNQRTPLPRDLAGEDGFVIDNPSAARFSQI